MFGRGLRLHAKLQLQGAVGFVRERDGGPEMMGLWGGAEQRWKGYLLKGSGVYDPEVIGRLQPEDVLVVAGHLPEGELL